MINYEALSEWEAILIMGLGFAAVLVIGQLLYRLFGIWPGHTRKFMHIGVGAVCLLFRYPFQNHWIVLGSVVFFIWILWITRRKTLLTALHREDIQSEGDWLLPVAIFLNFLLLRHYDYALLYYLPMLILTLSDPAAFYGGYSFGRTGKSIPGLLSFLFSALVICWFFFGYATNWSTAMRVWAALVVALLGALTEYLSRKGWDNITVPIVIGLALILYTEIFVVDGID
ncbi:MAG: hypothetical protein KDC44_11610 [Phaeodactylibacter sp.]|nr:hypothetical protein [Phaeodactylibacter sp.]